MQSVTIETDKPQDVGRSRKCLRCKRPVVEGVSICGACNQAGLPTPSASQFHGTLAVILIVLVLGAALIAPRVLGGPSGQSGFKAQVVDQFKQSPDALTAVVQVQNSGNNSAHGNCRVIAESESGGVLATAQVPTPEIGPGEIVPVQAQLNTSEIPKSMRATCR